MFASRTSLKSQKKCLISLINAPDGIPWGMSVYRGTSPEEYLKPVAQALEYETLPEKWGNKFENLANLVQKIIDDRQFFCLEEDKDKSQEFYISSNDMKNLFGQTILRKIINTTFYNHEAVAPSFRRESSFEDSRTYHVNESSSIQLEQERKIQEKLHASSPKLAIQTNGDNLGIIRLRQDRSAFWERNFVCEDITHLKTTRFYAHRANDTIAQGTFGKEYQRLRKADILNNFEWKCKIQASELMQHLADLASDLHNIHNKGLVHSDLKPDNILITKKGMIAIDSMNTPIGQNSKGVTVMYAAPEQIMRETVSPQTDQYAFGVILSELLGGVIYGEEVNFIIPTGGKNSTRMAMLKNPDVFFDPTTCAVPTKVIPEVRCLIKKCLSFKAADRFASIKEIAEEMHKWSKNHNFSYELEFPLNFGLLKQNKKEESYWLLTDSYR